MKSWVPIPILIPVNRGANPGFFPDPGQIGIPSPRFPGIPAQSGSGQNPEYFPDPGPVGMENPGYFPGQIGAGRGGNRGFRGLLAASSRQWQFTRMRMRALVASASPLDDEPAAGPTSHVRQVHDTTHSARPAEGAGQGGDPRASCWAGPDADGLGACTELGLWPRSARSAHPESLALFSVAFWQVPKSSWSGAATRPMDAPLSLDAAAA